MTNTLSNSIVAIIHHKNVSYSTLPPYHPPVIYPELGSMVIDTDPTNEVYSMVRDSFYLLGLDKNNYGQARWNPFEGFIKPGNSVLVKPNAVHHKNTVDTVFASITHPSILRVVIDYCIIALKGNGSITIADCPVMSCDFSRWMELMYISDIIKFYKEKTSIEINCLDLRKTLLKWQFGYTPNYTRKEPNLDPRGYTKVNLKEESAFSSFSEDDIKRLVGADDNNKETVELHSNGNHCYEVSNTFLECDVLISVPKLKVHKKVGITCNLKGMVGLIGNKNSIPHFRKNSPGEGGDEYPDYLPGFQKLLYRYRRCIIHAIRSKHSSLSDILYLLFDTPRRLLEYLFLKRSIRNKVLLGGSWYGNDTAWRMGPDLMKVALYGRRDSGRLCDQPRAFFSIVDGIIGGEDDGPLCPTGNRAGLILSGFNPVAVDCVASRLINLDYKKIKMLTFSKNNKRLKWEGNLNPVIKSNDDAINSLWDNDFSIPFKTPIGWNNHLELFK